MKIRILFILALSLLCSIVSAQDTIYSIVKSEAITAAGKPQYYKVATRDSVGNKRIVHEFAVTHIQKSELVTKKGESILPESGDWAISIDASPILRYVGNLVGLAGTNAAPIFSFLSGNQTILGKYYVDSEKAYRLGLRLGFGSNSSTSKVSTMPVATPIVYVDDVTKISDSDIGLTFGMEWRKGKTRLQGFYGAEAGLAVSSTGTSMTYGSNLSPNNPWSRLVENNSGTSFGIGFRGFIGAEYFIFPKIAIGGEFGCGLALRTVGEGRSTYQNWNGTVVKTSIYPTGGSTSFGLDSENLSSIFGPAGTLRLTLHF